MISIPLFYRMKNMLIDSEGLSELNSPEDFRKLGYRLIDLLASELEKANLPVDEQKAIEWEKPEDMLLHWSADFESKESIDPITLFKDIIVHSMNMNKRGNLGHQISAPHPLSVLSSTLMAHLNNGMGVYEVGMAGNAMEMVIIKWLAGLFNLPSGASGIITSGGSLGNMTALLTAKAQYLNKHPQTSLNNLTLLVSEEAHYSVSRAIAILGIPAENLIKVVVDDKFRMRTDLLEDYYYKISKEGKVVFCVVGSSCSTSSGSFDDLTSIAYFAKKHGIWFHVDAAHGGPAIFSKRYKSLLDGIDHADSIVMDFHKMMSVPSLSTAVLYRKGWHANLTFTQNAKYLWQDQKREEWYNSGKRTFECTKPMTIINIYTLVRIYGIEIFEQQIDYQYDLARDCAEYLSGQPDFDILCQPQANILCFRWI